MLGATLTTVTLAQDRQRSFDDQAGDGPMRGMNAPLREKVRGRLRGGDADAQAARFITRFDTDADGRVSSMEFVDVRVQNVDQYFERRDADGDGRISSVEYATPRTRPDRGTRPQRAAIDDEALAECVRGTIDDFEARRALNPEEAFAAIDADADGALSLQEMSAAFSARAQAQFTRLDADADGYVTAGDVEVQQDEARELRRAARACLREQRAG
ncbi:MAG TPA: hypothetical protein VGE69_05450 [Pseudomonadales bacterium]